MRPRIIIGYFAGGLGNSIGLFYVGRGKIAGVDAGSAKYQGAYEETERGDLAISMTLSLPPGQATITGLQSGPNGAQIPLNFVLPHDFETGRSVRIETPIGPLNARFELSQEIE